MARSFRTTRFILWGGNAEGVERRARRALQDAILVLGLGDLDIYLERPLRVAVLGEIGAGPSTSVLVTRAHEAECFQLLEEALDRLTAALNDEVVVVCGARQHPGVDRLPSYERVVEARLRQEPRERLDPIVGLELRDSSPGRDRVA